MITTISNDILLKKLIKNKLNEILSINLIKNKRLCDAARYSVLDDNNKMIRPQMLLSVSGESGIDVACSIELIHIYSLICDDLPCMDNDDLRHGKPTLHKQFDETTALLTGDFLLSLAFEVLSNAPYQPSIKVNLMQVISNKISNNGIIAGQILDIYTKSDKMSWSEYQNIAMLKTSSLFISTLKCGAIINKTNNNDTNILIEFGKVFGLIYQIADDLQDGDSSLDKHQAKKIINLLTLNAEHLLKRLSCKNIFLEKCLHTINY